MRILQVGTGAIKIPPQTYGGVELHVYEIAKHMVGSGHNVTILDIKTASTDPEMEQIDGIKFVRLHTKKEGIKSRNFFISFVLTRINTLLFALKVRRFLSNNEFEVIHLHATLIGLIVTFLNRKLRQKMVFTVESPIWDMAETIINRLDKLSIVADCYLVRRVGKVIVFTDALKEKLVSYGKIKPEKVSVVHLGVDINKFRPDIDSGDVTRKYELDGRTTVLFVGRIVPYKGIEYLVKAADIIVNRQGYKAVKFLLVGPLAEHETDKAEYADYIRRILDFLKEQNLESNVKFTGAMPYDDLPSLFAACDIFVLPSLAETFGLVISQAMASAKPIIGTRLAGILVQVRDGWNGYVVEPANEHQLADRIRYLIDHPEERKRMGLNSREFAEEKFDWSRVSMSILRVYAGMLT